LFPDAVNGTATQNGQIKPSFVTLKSDDKKDKTKKKRKWFSNAFKKSKKEKHLKAFRGSLALHLTNITSSYVGTNFSNHFNHGPTCNASVNLAL
jgi:hypothetical protein